MINDRIDREHQRHLARVQGRVLIALIVALSAYLIWAAPEPLDFPQGETCTTASC